MSKEEILQIIEEEIDYLKSQSGHWQVWPQLKALDKVKQRILNDQKQGD